VSLTALSAASLFPLAAMAQARTEAAAEPQAQDVPLPGEIDPAPEGAQSLQEDGSADEAIVVTGFRSSLAVALQDKRRQTVAVDSILSEDIGKFPDANLAESMQRLPGISLTRGDGGEGRNITVRGLAAEFTRVRINGMEGTSQTGASDAYGGSNNGRSFDFSVFPSEIFTSLAVRKTPSANVEEGSLGATIDLSAPHPLDSKQDFVLTATARALYNDVAKKVDPRFSGLISKTFADGTFGILASGSYGRRRTRDVGYSAVLVLPPSVNGGFCSPVGVTPINPNPATNASRGTTPTMCSTNNPRTGTVEAWNTLLSHSGGPNDAPGEGAFFPRLPRYLDSQQDAERYGGSLSFQWSPSEDTNVVLDGLYSKFDVLRADSYISGLSFARSASNSGQPMVSIRDLEINDRGSVLYGLYDGVDVRSERWIDDFSSTFKQANLTFEHRFSDAFKIGGLVGYSVSSLDQAFRGWVNLDSNDADGFSVDFRDNTVFPTIDFGIDVADPSNFAYAPGLANGTVFGTWGGTKLDRTTKNQTYTLDAEFTPREGINLLVGAQRRVSDYRSDALAIVPARRGTQQLPAGTSVADISLQITGLDKLLGYGAPATWVAADHDKWREAVGYDDEAWWCGAECGSGDSGVEETITSGYGMVTFDTSEFLSFTLRGDAGVRYVHTDQYSFGRIPVNAPAGSLYPTIGQLAEAERSYDDWLPSANLVAEITPDLLVRLSAAKVMSRPQLAPLIPSSGVDAVGRRGSINNPFLDPIRATTYDAAVEWYFLSGSLLSVAYFRKDISTYIQSISSLIPFNQLGLPENLLDNTNTAPDELFTINRLTNTPGGTLEGVEVNAQTPFTFLPGVLRNFGALGSLTLVKSSINYVLESANGVPTLTVDDDLVGLSRASASGTLYYEGGGFSARVTGNYRSDFIRTIPSGALYSDYIGNEPTFFMDFSASYQVTDRFRVLLEAQNLTDEVNVQYIDSTRRDSLFALRNGRTVTLGVNFQL
jgi:TonB-dependent receptor